MRPTIEQEEQLHCTLSEHNVLDPDGEGFFFPTTIIRIFTRFGNPVAPVPVLVIFAVAPLRFFDFHKRFSLFLRQV